MTKEREGGRRIGWAAEAINSKHDNFTCERDRKTPRKDRETERIWISIVNI